ncbi:carboxymuconolactone decarboxylase family protein [Novosphingobium sp. SG720]|uniref:carboxymuconolactone decarboxylase family protein n=1 Tax=Novosphingobium sp. SG720 TaxID=2586998 RepID=UPI00184BF8FE|nr:carboxymuconolactone decarboxylase family protein [Novosphingobium sp. SG720]NKJ44809.1 4-carboxymuconolactone decarboxylase [Novosphingobium sp. SG720]
MDFENAPRIAAVTPEAMTADQRAAADALAAGPRQAVRGPFAVLLHSTGVFGPAQALGAYLRFESTIPARLRELAIIATARHWRQDYEWQVHAPLARDAGLAEAAIAAIAAGDVPQDLAPDECTVLDFTRQLHATGQVDDETFTRAQALLAPAGVVELCAICGYYAMLAMVMNVARNPSPPNPSAFS